MKKIIRLIILIVVVFFLLSGLYLILQKKENVNKDKIFNPINASYIIDGQTVPFVNGQSSKEYNKNGFIAVIFGQVVYGDLNNDQVDDAALLIQVQGSGSGTFYYIAAAINNDGQAEGSEAILLGDRISPQNINIKDQYLVANYAIRKPGEPMSTPASIAVSAYFVFDNTGLHLTSSPTQMISYFSSNADKNKYCNGVEMESVAYQNTITELKTVSSTLIKPTEIEFIKSIILAATSGNCRDALAKTDISFKNGVVSIAPIDAWAGVSIAMCSCKPEVEVNLLSLPGVNQIIWE